MAPFETPETQIRFEETFQRLLVPNLFDGFELVEAVMQLEGLPGKRAEMDRQAARLLDADDQPSLVGKLAEWHPYNPNAERDTRLAAEELYYDPIKSPLNGVNRNQR